MKNIFIVILISVLIPYNLQAGWFSADAPDISVKEISMTPSVVKQGALVRFIMVISNEGTEKLKDIPILLPYAILNDKKTPLKNERQVEYINLLPTNEFRTFQTIEITLDYPAGNYFFTLGPVRLGGRLKRQETNLSDNTKVMAFEIQPENENPDTKLLVLPHAPPLEEPEKQVSPVEPVEPEEKPRLLTKVEEANTIDDLEKLRQRAMEFFRRQKYAQADALYKRIISLADITLGKYHPFSMRVLTEAADLHRRWGKNYGGKKIQIDYISRLEKVHGKNSKELIEPLYEYGEFLDRYYSDKKGCYDKFDRAINIMKGNDVYEGGDAHLTLSSYFSAAMSYHDYKKALWAITEAVSLHEKHNGAYSLGIEFTENNIRHYCKKQHLTVNDFPLYKRLMALRNNQLPADPKERTRILNNRCARLMETDCKAAYEVALQCVKAAEEAYGNESPEAGAALHHLVMCAERLGKIREARLLAERYVDLTCNREKKASAFIQVGAIEMLARFYQKHDNVPDKVEKLLKQATILHQRRYGPNQFNTGRALEDLGRFYLKQNRAEEALPILERARAIYVESKGEHSFFAGRILKPLIKAAEATGDYKQAEVYRIKGRELPKPKLSSN